ncbi:MAG: hypothetical protein ACRD6X_20970, partial [Pyrinomonadaceae bacterium]
MALTGIPVDMDQNPVNGLAVEWKSSDEQILKITNNEMAVAVEEGKATLTASSGKTNREIVVNVSAGSKASNLDDLPLEPTISEEQAANMVSPENNLGNPPGQTELTGRSRAAAARTRERHGSSNYSFGLPVASLPGRGIDASVGIAYNSRVWNKSTIFGETSFEFNTNKNWLAPGFEVGYGYIEGYFAGFSYGYLLTAPDGTRSQLIQKQSSGNCTTYESADGTFVQTTVCGSYGQATAIVVRYADGSQVTYGPHTQTGKRYPTGIQDRNGNYITIAYIQNDMQGKIAYIKDTLNRYITFNYDTTPEKKLVAVTVPGFDDSPTPRQTIRFYYEDMALQTAGRFDDQTYVNAPATINVLRHVYFPGTQTGFRYDYSPYFGMIYKISQRRGMQVTTTSLTDTGTVVNEGTEASWTHYNYAATPGELGGIPLTDVPKYSWRKDDWQGRTTTVPQTNFFTDEAVTPTNCEISAGTCTGTRTTTITAPDGTRSVSVSNIRPTADWENGLLSETRISTIESSAERVWSKTRLYWEQGDNQPTGRDNPRLSKIEVTNDAGQTRATNFAYDGYNNPSVVSEHDFAAEGVLGAELRRTETTYETGAGWIANRMIRLPKEIKTVVGSTTVSKVQYEYDNYSGGNGLVNAPGVMQHSQKFNPFNPGTHVCNCRWECDLSLAGGETDGADPSQAQSCPG